MNPGFLAAIGFLCWFLAGASALWAVTEPAKEPTE